MQHKQPLEEETEIRIIFKVKEEDLFHHVGSQLLQTLLQARQKSRVCTGSPCSPVSGFGHELHWQWREAPSPL